MQCPKCQSTIDDKEINIQADIARCSHCQHIFKISEQLQPSEDGFDMFDTPKGIEIDTGINHLHIRASTRSNSAFFIVPFAFVWSGFSLGGIYGSQLVSGETNILLSLFGIPFILGSVLIWSQAFMAIWGKVEVTLDENGGKIFTGVGSIGRTKEFAWDEVVRVNEFEGESGHIGKRPDYLAIEGQKRIKFGTRLKTEKRYHILRTLQEVLLRVKNGSSIV